MLKAIKGYRQSSRQQLVSKWFAAAGLQQLACFSRYKHHKQAEPNFKGFLRPTCCCTGQQCQCMPARLCIRQCVMLCSILECHTHRCSNDNSSCKLLNVTKHNTG
jgi:hypothetical protein